MPTTTEYTFKIPDHAWPQLASLFPRERPRRRGRPWRSHRQILEGIFWALNTNEPWRQMPEEYGPWQTIYDRWVRWNKDGTMSKIFTICHAELGWCDFIEREECQPRGGMTGERHGFCRALREEDREYYFSYAA